MAARINFLLFSKRQKAVLPTGREEGRQVRLKVEEEMCECIFSNNGSIKGLAKGSTEVHRSKFLVGECMNGQSYPRRHGLLKCVTVKEGPGAPKTAQAVVIALGYR